MGVVSAHFLWCHETPWVDLSNELFWNDLLTFLGGLIWKWKRVMDSPTFAKIEKSPESKQTFEKLIAAKWAWLAPIFFDATKLHE